jgi:gluconate 5-dehydrogenase
MRRKSMRLRDRVAIVTGGASGMGEAISLLFTEEGATVIIADINNDKATSVASRIQNSGRNARAFRIDVTNEQQVRSLADAVVAEFKRIDILVNCAGIMDAGPAEEMTLEQWRRIIDIDLTGVFICCREVGRVMVKQRSGKIINFGSTVALSGAPNTAHYTAAKHGVLGLTRALAVEWGKYNINVNCICPGGTLTPMVQSQPLPPEYWTERIKRIPLGRLAKPEDQARAALFLASSDSDYISGSVLCVDGGVTAMAPGTPEKALQGGR